MVQYNLKPYWVQFTYTTDGLNHVGRYSIEPSGTPDVGVEPDLVTNDDTITNFDAAMDALWGYIAPFYPSDTCSFGEAIVYRQLPTDPSPVWIYSFTTSVAATGTGSISKVSQQTITFRDDMGGVSRFVLLETLTDPYRDKSSIAELSAAEGGLMYFLIGTDSFLRARSGAKYMQFKRLTVTTNDKLEKIRYNVG